jgi:hypothetical protein
MLAMYSEVEQMKRDKKMPEAEIETTQYFRLHGEPPLDEYGRGLLSYL